MVRPDHVVFWGPLFEKVGTVTSQANTSSVFQALGVKTTFVAYYDEYPAETEFSHVWRSSRWFTRFLKRLKPVLKARPANLLVQLAASYRILLGLPPFGRDVVIHTSLSAMFPLWAARLRGCTVISSIQGLPSFLYEQSNLATWRRWEAKLRRQLWKSAYKSAYIYTISSDSQKKLQEMGLTQTRFIPNVVEVGAESKRTKRNMQKIAIVGRLSYQKNLPLLLYLVKHLTQYSWDVFGDATDPEGQKFVDEIRALPQTTFHGFQTAPFSKTDAGYLMFPSLWDEAALTPIEAAKAGLKVIYSDRCFGSNDFFHDNRLEIKVDCSFSDTLSHIRDILSEGAPQTFSDIYSFDNHKRELAKLLDEI